MPMLRKQLEKMTLSLRIANCKKHPNSNTNLEYQILKIGFGIGKGHCYSLLNRKDVLLLSLNIDFNGKLHCSLKKIAKLSIEFGEQYNLYSSLVWSGHVLYFNKYFALEKFSVTANFQYHWNRCFKICKRNRSLEKQHQTFYLEALQGIQVQQGYVQ